MASAYKNRRGEIIKNCNKCLKSKNISQFYIIKNKNGKYPTSKCKACVIEYGKQRRLKRPKKTVDAERRYRLKRKGLTEQEFISLKKKQNYKCAICKRKNANSALCIDHNHITNKVRGLLCHNCNKALGLFQDNPEFLMKASQYLKEGG